MPVKPPRPRVPTTRPRACSDALARTCTASFHSAQEGRPPVGRYRDALELDSLDFLSFIETLSRRTGVRIDDEDTPRLVTLSGCAEFLTSHPE